MLRMHELINQVPNNNGASTGNEIEACATGKLDKANSGLRQCKAQRGARNGSNAIMMSIDNQYNG